ncbi:MAG: hypothetical protein ACLUOS_10465 [Odoribacter splanchnicus]
MMTGGMATIAGGYWLPISVFWVGRSGTTVDFAKHLLAASVMAAPGAVVFAKMLVPRPGR